MLGGRAASFHDPASDQWIDHCQHVGMACCTNLSDFCQRTGISKFIRRDRVLHFIGPDGRVCKLQASRWLPAPLHLAPSMARLTYLSFRDKWRVGHAIWKLIREPTYDGPDRPTIGEWLRAQKQSPEAIKRFWEVVLVSALGESLELASMPAARKVFVDGFMAACEAYEIDIPVAPLSELYGSLLAEWLASRGITVHLGASVKQVSASSDHFQIEVAGGAIETFNHVVLATNWRRVGDLVDVDLRERLPWIDACSAIQSSPISAVHLWFDRPITDLSHAVIVGRLSQWLFQRGTEPSGERHDKAYYYQVVISASQDLGRRPREEVIEIVCSELAAIWPAAREARLLRSRLVTEQAAVFSVRPGIDALRPQQKTAVPGLFVAGDWTSTGWPATMESAVRSGYLAAEGILQAIGQPRRILVPDLPRGWLAKRLLGG